VHTIFSTVDVPQAEAFGCWLDIARASIRRHDMEAIGDWRDWYGTLKAGPLGDLTLASWRSAMGISRCPGSSDGDLLLFLPSSRAIAEFGDDWYEHNRNNLSLIDTAKPHVARSLEPVERVFLRIPRDVLARRIRITRGVVNRPLPLGTPDLPGSIADAELLEAFMRDLMRVGPSNLSPAVAVILREQLLDLTAVVLGNLTGTMPRLGAAARFGTLKLRVVIDSQLTNPEADAQSIAAGAGVSERHANRLLALEGTSIRRLLIERRLNKCREMIEDPRHLHRSISDIASFYGFRHLSHFTRVFKERFGLSPSAYRSAFHSIGH